MLQCADSNTGKYQGRCNAYTCQDQCSAMHAHTGRTIIKLEVKHMMLKGISLHVGVQHARCRRWKLTGIDSCHNQDLPSGSGGIYTEGVQ